MPLMIIALTHVGQKTIEFASSDHHIELVELEAYNSLNHGVSMSHSVTLSSHMFGIQLIIQQIILTTNL